MSHHDRRKAYFAAKNAQAQAAQIPVQPFDAEAIKATFKSYADALAENAQARREQAARAELNDLINYQNHLTLERLRSRLVNDATGMNRDFP